MLLVNPDCSVRSELVLLAQQNGIPEATEGMMAEVLSAYMQKRWLRRSEHQFQISGSQPSDDQWSLLTKLCLTQEIRSPDDDYCGALLLGGTVVAVRKRLRLLIQQRTNGVSLQTVYLLGGSRPLDPQKESPSVLYNPAELPFKQDWTAPNQAPRNEAEMMCTVYQQSEVPSEWKVVLVNTPRQPTEDGKGRDPNTTDTVKQFLQLSPPRGEYLVVSSQPFVERQTIDVENVLPSNKFAVDGIGYKASRTLPLKTFLDEAARLLHEEAKYFRD